MTTVIEPTEIHTVPNLESPMRLQEYGVGIFELAPTKSAWKKVLKKNCVTVNGFAATTATQINGGEEIVFTPPEEIRPKKDFIFSLQVLYEDDDLAVIHKPAGILVSGNSFMTIANALEQNLKPSAQTDACRPKSVHRLDYATTGALLIGKTQSSIRELSKQFEEKLIKKTYLAITIGAMKKSGTIDTKVDDKEAKSEYNVLDTVKSPRFGYLNLLELIPHTGRKHQLRVHLSTIGNPILGDRDYSPEKLLLKGKGMYLHAYSLQFNHPKTGKEIFIKDHFIERFTKIFPEFED